MAKRVLLADDNESVRTILKLTLQFKGCTVIEVEDGAKAFEALKADSTIDLLVTDIAMPGLSGLELLAKIRADPSLQKLPIVVCSAEADAKEADILARGADAFLPKPCSPVKLMETVARLLL